MPDFPAPHRSCQREGDPAPLRSPTRSALLGAAGDHLPVRVIAATACGGSTRSVRIRSAVRCAPATFKGASTAYGNYDGDNRVHLSEYKDGKLSVDYPLGMFSSGPTTTTQTCCGNCSLTMKTAARNARCPTWAASIPSEVQLRGGDATLCRGCQRLRSLLRADLALAWTSWPPTLCLGRGPLDS
jgi:hypothetical protein